MKRKSPSSTAPSNNPKPSSHTLDTLNLRHDRLGTLVSELIDAFTSSPSWESFVHEFRGPSYLAPELDELDHPAADLLRQWRDEGVPVLSDSEPWTLEQKDA